MSVNVYLKEQDVKGGKSDHVNSSEIFFNVEVSGGTNLVTLFFGILLDGRMLFIQPTVLFYSYLTPFEREWF